MPKSSIRTRNKKKKNWKNVKICRVSPKRKKRKFVEIFFAKGGDRAILSVAKLILMTYSACKRWSSRFVESSCISSKPVLQLRHRPWLREHSGKGMLTNGSQLLRFGVSRGSMTTINLERFNFFRTSCPSNWSGFEFPLDQFYRLVCRVIIRHIVVSIFNRVNRRLLCEFVFLRSYFHTSKKWNSLNFAMNIIFWMFHGVSRFSCLWVFF